MDMWLEVLSFWGEIAQRELNFSMCTIVIKIIVIGLIIPPINTVT